MSDNQLNNFREGDWWQCRGGSLVQITEIDENLGNYPIWCNDGSGRSENGSFISSGAKEDLDLVSRIKPPTIEFLPNDPDFGGGG